MSNLLVRRLTVVSKWLRGSANTSSFLATQLVSCRHVVTNVGGNRLETPPIIAPTSVQMELVAPSFYRSSFNDPLQHNVQHLHKFYKLDSNDIKRLDPFNECLRPDFYAHCKAFHETSLMIRQPAVEIINHLRNIDLSLPAYRFVLFGPAVGTGKRSTLLHLLHYCFRDNWLIVHLPNCSRVLRSAPESQPSTYKEGRVDTPINALNFLKRFVIQNQHLLGSLDLKTTKEYTWSNRDSTPVGTPIVDLIEYANTRVKYASDICGALIREIKAQAKDKNFKVFVAVEQMNSYFGPTRLKRPDKSRYDVEEVTIVRNFKKLLQNDWTNAVVVGSICDVGVIIPGPNKHKKFYDTSIPIAKRRRVKCTLHYEGPLTPLALLKKQGFYHLEPFVPVEVPAYSDKEFEAHYDYYRELNWLQNPESQTTEGREEIKFLCGKNPYEFMRVCQII